MLRCALGPWDLGGRRPCTRTRSAPGSDLPLLLPPPSNCRCNAPSSAPPRSAPPSRTVSDMSSRSPCPRLFLSSLCLPALFMCCLRFARLTPSILPRFFPAGFGPLTFRPLSPLPTLPCFPALSDRGHAACFPSAVVSHFRPGSRPGPARCLRLLLNRRRCGHASSALNAPSPHAVAAANLRVGGRGGAPPRRREGAVLRARRRDPRDGWLLLRDGRRGARQSVGRVFQCLLLRFPSHFRVTSASLPCHLRFTQRVRPTTRFGGRLA
jgi:hypothetical protein